MDKFDRCIDVLARELYSTHWKQNPTTGRFPPIWENASKEVKEYVRKQAQSVAEEALSLIWTDTEFENIRPIKNV